MDKLTFKNYPPIVLVLLIILIIIVNFVFQVLWGTIWENKSVGFWEEVICIASSYSLVIGVISFINRKCTWRWVYKLLGLPYLSGNYTGYTISSFHEDNDPDKANMKRYCKVQMLQNINALKITGEFFTDELCTDQTSDFESFGEEITKKDNGDFEISYFFVNEGRLLHPDHKKYGLNNHRGVCKITFRPSADKMKGEYFTYERSSYGEICLQLKK